MTRTTTNLLGILITILGGTFIYVQLCSSCGIPMGGEPVATNAPMTQAPGAVDSPEPENNDSLAETPPPKGKSNARVPTGGGIATAK